MNYNLDDLDERYKAAQYFDKLLEGRKNIELKEVKKTRSSAQNRALHLYFSFISDELNAMGREFSYDGVKGFEMSCPYTPDIVKNFFWRPIQMTLFEKESTKDITTQEINSIIDVVNKFFAEKGIKIEFPDYYSLMAKIHT